MSILLKRGISPRPRNRLRSLIPIIFGPPGVILLGSLIVASGAFWAAKKSESKSVAQVQLLQDISARAGNQKELDELIRARSRALNSNRDRADDIASGIIKRLPVLTEEARALERDKLDAYGQQAADFRLKWEPFIIWTIQRFDSVVSQLQNRGIDLKMEEPKNNFFFIVKNHEPGPTPVTVVRTVTYLDSQLIFDYTPLDPAAPGPPRDFRMRTGFAGVSFLLYLDNKQARGTLTSPGEKPREIRSIVAPKDGAPSPELSKFVEEGLETVFEKLLVITNAKVNPNPN